jgi:beta-glucanase (GH16 family)
MGKIIDWCGYTWECCMEGGRIIHEEQPWMWYDEDMVSVDENGVLSLNACVNPKHVITWDGKEFDPTYAVGLIRNANPENIFTYGRYCCEIQLPDGTNCWNSFWLVGDDMPWPEGGEIDIMEGFQKKSSYFRFLIPQPPYVVPSWWVTSNVHYKDENGEHAAFGSRGTPICKLIKNPKKHFIKYECEWLPDKVTFFVNGRKTRIVKNPPRLHDRMRVIFDCWGQEYGFSVTQPMKCKNFKYEPL